MIDGVALLNMKIYKPQKAKGICLEVGVKLEIPSDFIRYCDTFTKPGLFAQMSWIYDD